MADSWGGTFGSPSSWGDSFGIDAVTPPAAEVVTGGRIRRRRWADNVTSGRRYTDDDEVLSIAKAFFHKVIGR